MKSHILFEIDTDGEKCGDCKYRAVHKLGPAINGVTWVVGSCDWCEVFRTIIEHGKRCRYCLDAEQKERE